MHAIEPHFPWRDYYIAAKDQRSPFYGRVYSEIEFTHAIYDHVIHPQWDDIESPTLYIKILYVDYDKGFATIEMIGEWNDLLHNDIMFLKRNVIDELTGEGIDKFIMIGENVLNYHASDDSYYEEWFDDVEDGWIAFVNFRAHVMADFQEANIDYYVISGGELDDLNWRLYTPQTMFEKVDSMVIKRIGA
ncbi:MAG: hypothetical protein JKY48_10670 [Flavobacteriales bacterium]|nr:hypothetical protein [Flavobacteriales bacterium]